MPLIWACVNTVKKARVIVSFKPIMSLNSMDKLWKTNNEYHLSSVTIYKCHLGHIRVHIAVKRPCYRWTNASVSVEGTWKSQWLTWVQIIAALIYSVKSWTQICLTSFWPFGLSAGFIYQRSKNRNLDRFSPWMRKSGRFVALPVMGWRNGELNQIASAQGLKDSSADIRSYFIPFS